MKYISTLITMVVGGAVLALGSSGVAETVKPCVVTVVRIQGQARYSLGDNAWHPLVVGKVLGAGAIIQSAVNSSVDIVLSGNAVAMPQASPSPDTITFAPDPNVRGMVSYKPMVEQNVIRMWGNSVLAVDKLTQFDAGVQTISDTELDLRAGRIFFNIKKMSATSQFIIKIPNGVAGIRGSSGFIDANGDMAMHDGSAVLSLVVNGTPFTHVVNGGSEFNPATGNVTPIPQNIMDNLMTTLTSLITLYQSPGGEPPPQYDTTQCYTSNTTGKRE
ncbi:MAG TPA: FecR domain-containing protein [Verrucomicrobiae bacterium]|nr:FecR domain-containing protein [Verrucomicrobiae bacterium]